MSAMSAMVNFEIPWINLMTKMDLVSQTKEDTSGARISFRKRRNVARCGVYLPCGPVPDFVISV